MVLGSESVTMPSISICSSLGNVISAVFKLIIMPFTVKDGKLFVISLELAVIFVSPIRWHNLWHLSLLGQLLELIDRS